MTDSMAVSIIFKFSCHSSIHKPSFQSSCTFDSTLKHTIDFVVQSRNRWEECRFQKLTVFNEFQLITLVESSFHSSDITDTLQHMLEDMGRWKVRYVSIVLCEWISIVPCEIGKHFIDKHFVS